MKSRANVSKDTTPGLTFSVSPAGAALKVPARISFRIWSANASASPLLTISFPAYLVTLNR
jgi:hypothetical protein